MKSFAIIGGDKRNIALAQLLFEQGHDVRMFGFEKYEREFFMHCKNIGEVIAGANYIIGATPCSHGGEILNAPFHAKPLSAKSVFELIQPHQIFIAGHVSEAIHEAALKYSVQLVDMLEREELLILNAIPTAEGAIKIAIEETDFTLHASEIMVIGYGRIGQVLCRMLAGIGARVTTVVNSPHAYAHAKSASHNPVYFEDIKPHLSGMAVVYNTVPKAVLDASNMSLLKNNVLIIDLASPPYGVDSAVARDLGLRVLYSTSLPGKVAPATTAKYMLDTVWQIIEEAKGELL